MRQKFVLFTLILFFVGTAAVIGATEYGQAQIKKGKMTVVRDGSSQEYMASEDSVLINTQDVIRTSANSTVVVLVKEDQSVITLGGNAILQAKPWKSDKVKGTLRMLFGKFLAQTSVFGQKKRLDILTTTAVIGVKGSTAKIETTPSAMSLSNLEGSMEMKKPGSYSFSGVDEGQIGIALDDGNTETKVVENTSFKPKAKKAETKAEGEAKEEKEVAKEEVAAEEAELDTQDAKDGEIPTGISESDLAVIQDVAVAETNVVAGVDDMTPSDSPAGTEKGSDVKSKDSETQTPGATESNDRQENAPPVDTQQAANEISNDIGGTVTNAGESANDAASASKARIKITIEK